ncbi:hypothetical protein HRD76_10510 [Enterococcus faecalis]|uniref:hypothetical protein n=1 Tax=Enterococcus faecalis TaxID=1351 RepID=UPI0015710CF9|nr:hypothetical protein [Enterococcus faecalis]MCH1672799.1 hypothetical protein [Enterococcus faecalis]NSN01053.1 hypothetical protein [Enterococcus faecalis]
MIDRHVTFEEEHQKVIDDIIKNVPGVNNLSQAFRYLCMEYDGKNKKMRERKLNAMSKELSILLTIITSAMEETIDVSELKEYKNSTLYARAKGIVEETIQTNTTFKATKRKEISERKTDDLFAKRSPF